MSDPRLKAALNKWALALNGQRPVISSQELEVLGEHFQTCEDQTAATLYFKGSRTLPNPARVGVLDEFILFV